MRRLVFQSIILVSLILSACSGRSNSHSISSWEFISIDSTLKGDSAAIAFIEPYRTQLDSTMNEVIGYSSATMISDKPEGTLSSLVGDIVYNAGLEILNQQDIEYGSTMALVNVRGIRAPLPEGVVRLVDAYQIMPFDNNLTAVRLNGSLLKEVFDHIAHRYGEGLSNASFTLLADSTASNIIVAGKELNPEESYWLFTSDFIASGGDKFFMFQRADTIIATNIPVRDLIIEHIKKEHLQGKVLNPDTIARITVIK